MTILKGPLPPALGLALLAILAIPPAAVLAASTHEVGYFNGKEFDVATQGDIQVFVSLSRGALENDLTALVYIANAGEKTLAIPRVEIKAEAVRTQGGTLGHERLTLYTAAQYEKMAGIQNKQGSAASPAPGGGTGERLVLSAEHSYSTAKEGGSGMDAVPPARALDRDNPQLHSMWAQSRLQAGGGFTNKSMPSGGYYQSSAEVSHDVRVDWRTRKQTLAAKNYYGGEVHFKDSKEAADSYRMTIRVAGQEFEFEFSSK
jgi:hypothetical protein